MALTKKQKSKNDKTSKLPKTLNYLFEKGGLKEKQINFCRDNVVKLDDILSVYTDFTEEDFRAALPDNISESGLYHLVEEGGVLCIIFGPSSPATASIANSSGEKKEEPKQKLVAKKSEPKEPEAVTVEAKAPEKPAEKQEEGVPSAAKKRKKKKGGNKGSGIKEGEAGDKEEQDEERGEFEEAPLAAAEEAWTVKGGTAKGGGAKSGPPKEDAKKVEEVNQVASKNKKKKNKSKMANEEKEGDYEEEKKAVKGETLEKVDSNVGASVAATSEKEKEKEGTNRRAKRNQKKKNKQQQKGDDESLQDEDPYNVAELSPSGDKTEESNVSQAWDSRGNEEDDGAVGKEESVAVGKQKKKKNEDLNQKILKTLNYLFLKNGLNEKGIRKAQDGSVNAQSIAEFYHYTVESIKDVAQSTDVFATWIDPDSEEVFVKCNRQPDVASHKGKPEESREGGQTFKGTRKANDDDAGQWEGEQKKQKRGGASEYEKKDHKKTGGVDMDKLARSLWWLLGKEGFKGIVKPLPDDSFLIEDILHVPQFSNFTVEDVQKAVQEDRRRSFVIGPGPNGRHCIKLNADRQTGGTDREFRISKALSYILRHGAADYKLALKPGGFLWIKELLPLKDFKGVTLEDIERIVKNNDKQRFFMDLDPENHLPRIRANQGHSVEVNVQLESLTSDNLQSSGVRDVVHGTYHEAWERIKMEGLKRMGRNHIHFAPGEPGDSGVISGMRGSCEILIYIDLQKALADGLEFFRSANNVILCAGDENGIIDPKYFTAVWQRRPRVRLYP